MQIDNQPQYQSEVEPGIVLLCIMHSMLAQLERTFTFMIQRGQQVEPDRLTGTGRLFWSLLT